MPRGLSDEAESEVPVYVKEGYVMRSRFVLTAALGIAGALNVPPALRAQVSNAGKAPELPAPMVWPGPWRNVGGNDTPCLNAWGNIYECPPAPTTVAIRAGRM